MDLSQLPEIEARRLPARPWLERQLARPARWASMGAGVLVLVSLVMFAMFRLQSPQLEQLAGLLFVAVILGAPLGYLCGFVVAAFSLLQDRKEDGT